jgi:phosphoribosylformimino-5-aminoimidazole carboxamide ribotide isomerase
MVSGQAVDMLILPAIDLKDGKCVRLLQGRKEDVTVYGDDPAAMATRWADEGAEYLHVVDLDGAFTGESANLGAIRSIVDAIDIPCQVGGGIRDLGAVSRLLNIGVDRVIIGTVAVTHPDLVIQLIERFGPERIVVGIDARDGEVAIKGWETSAAMTVDELSRQIRSCGVKRVVYTDIARDGMLGGPNNEATVKLAKESGLKVMASGGVSTLDDIALLVEIEGSGVEAVITGKALYEGSFSLADAIALTVK